MRENWSNITEKELSRLFPIILMPHNPQLREYFVFQKEYLQSVFGDKIIRISHIGSTAVTGLLAKPTVDILLEIAEDTDLLVFSEILLDDGYVINHSKDDIITYIKGYTPRGFEGQAVHVHVRYRGDWGELYFRDYLEAHSDAAAEYAALKQELQSKFRFDRDGYTEAKGAFIERITKKARAEFRNRFQ